MRTANPVLSDRVFEGVRPVTSGDVMTVDGTVNKTLIALFLTMISAYWTYGNPAAIQLLIPALVGGLIVALVTSFKTSLAPYTTPVYALVQGVVLGGISFMYESLYEGIVTQAVFLTFGVMFGLLLAYKSGVIRVTDTFKRIIIAGTAGIFLFYLVAMIARLFGASFSFMHDSSPLSIGISLFICGFAAMNLVLDFDRIEQYAKSGSAPKYMEWFCALGLLATLIWLYIELLHLLSKLRGRD